MKATFAVLVSNDICNAVRSLVWEIHQKYGTTMKASHLPPHISVRPPVDVPDIADFETYMDELVRGLRPFPVHLTNLRVMPAMVDGRDSALLWMEVKETPVLRQLHDRINEDFAARFARPRADFGGHPYQFHLTLMFGGQPLSVYQRIYEEYAGRLSEMYCMAGELAMLVYDGQNHPNPDQMTYKVLPFGGRGPGEADSSASQNLTMV